MTELKTICEALKAYCEKREDCKYCPFHGSDDEEYCGFIDMAAGDSPNNWVVHTEEIVILREE